jgi:hypothetical protein
MDITANAAIFCALCIFCVPCARSATVVHNAQKMAQYKILKF